MDLVESAKHSASNVTWQVTGRTSSTEAVAAEPSGQDEREYPSQNEHINANQVEHVGSVSSTGSDLKLPTSKNIAQAPSAWAIHSGPWLRALLT